MDDLKFYMARGRKNNRVDESYEFIFEDIGMEFGFENGAMLSIKRGVRLKSEGIEVPSGELIREVDEGGYKYPLLMLTILSYRVINKNVNPRSVVFMSYEAPKLTYHIIYQVT